MTQMAREEEKKRLVELMEQSPVVMGFGCTWHDFFSALADDLLSNGVIVPPCKVGDTVYEIGDYCLDPTDDYCDNVCSSCKYHCMTIRDELIGSWYKSITVMRYWRKDYFPTREEAEQALDKRKVNAI